MSMPALLWAALTVLATSEPFTAECVEPPPHLQVRWPQLTLSITPEGFRLDTPATSPSESSLGPKLLPSPLAFGLPNNLIAFCPEHSRGAGARVAVALSRTENNAARVWLTSTDGSTRYVLSLREALRRAVRRGPIGAPLGKAIMQQTCSRDAVDAGSGLPSWPKPTWLARHLAKHPEPRVRGHAAACLARGRSAKSVAQLWRLTQDPNPMVRESALTAVLANQCQTSTPGCAAVLGMFVDDPVRAIAWRARHRMLQTVPERALRDASRRFKLDALAVLSLELQQQPSPAARHALRLLENDPDPQVRSTARHLRAKLRP